jgi:hypothetical protein
VGRSWGRGRGLTVRGAHAIGAAVAGEGDGSTGRAHEPARVGARERATALTGQSHWTGRERRRASERGTTPTGGVHLSASARGQLAGLVWAERSRREAAGLFSLFLLF